ncbi:MAG: hypothetical protein DME24_13045 [Verrucomicrobia bacterium]|nr:MAG: hypothetical protein DME24_13045 [Verrucomicrobiota bacterium]
MRQFCQDRFIPFQNAEQFPDSQVWNLRPRVRGRIWIPHHARERFPLPTTEEWGEGQGEGISKERDNSMGTSPSPLPARASQGEGAEDFRDGGCIKMRRASDQPMEPIPSRAHISFVTHNIFLLLSARRVLRCALNGKR